MSEMYSKIRENGEASGRIMERYRNLQALLRNTDWTMEKAVQMMGITEEEMAEVGILIQMYGGR